MHFLFANKLDELMQDPSVAAYRLRPSDLAGLSDRACDIIDELDEMTCKLFKEQGTFTPKQSQALLTRGYEVKQAQNGVRFKLTIHTPLGDLSF